MLAKKDEILYVFSLVRHGARSPNKDLSLYHPHKGLLPSYAKPHNNKKFGLKTNSMSQLMMDDSEMRQEVMAVMEQEEKSNFKSAPDFGMLTAVGMRQRYLLGRYDAEKYAKMLDGSKKVFVVSTNVYRTIQSAYAELAGAVYAQKQSPRFTLT